MQRWPHLFLFCLVFTVTSCGLLGDQDGSRDKSIDDFGANVDLKAEELSPNGCLDLSLLTERFLGFPESILIRKHTVSFSISPVATDGYAVARMRNFAAESALAALEIEEQTPLDFSEGSPIVRQDGCSKVEFENSIGAKDVYNIDGTASSERQLVLSSEDGFNKRSYILKSPRLIEITVTAPKIDRCPTFQKVMTMSTYSLEWGLESEIRGRPVRIATDYLRQITIAVEAIPAAIIQLLSGSTSGFVEPQAPDLRVLKTAALDPQITRCPFHTQPPVADEPPPPEQVPEPAPAPGTLPVPEPIPEFP